jgi:monoamine oxidase
MDVLVVGAGLAGLTAADILAAAGASVTVVEARTRVGGRIMSIRPEGLGEGASFDLGATWLWDDQPAIRALAGELGLDVFAQYRDGRGLVEEDGGDPPAPVDVPPPSPAELRLVDGAQELCLRLADRLPPDSLVLGTSVTALASEAGGVTVGLADDDGETSELRADAVVVAVPPRLAHQRITFTPTLSTEFAEVLQATPTWMGTALKCVAVYESPFWRDAGWAGLAFSEVGPLREVHDACTSDGSAAGLWGFVAGDHAYRDLTFDERAERVFEHLGRLFGPPAADPLQYFERDWSNDPNTNDEVIWVGRDVVDYGHPSYAEPMWHGRLVWAGTETMAEGGGHMEGAVRSGQRAARLLLEGQA